MLVRRSRRDFFIIVSTLVLIAATVSAVWLSDIPRNQIVKWTGFSLITAVLFWYAIADRSASLRRRPFWLVATLILLAHCVTWTIVLIHIERWKLVWFGPLISLELIAVFYSVDRLSRKPRPTPHTTRTPKTF